jgi:hypothetical protein
MNKITSVSIACTPHRLNNMNDDIRSQRIYLLIGDVVTAGEDADGDEARDDGTRSRSSMRGRGTFPLKMPRARRRRRQRLDAAFGRRTIVWKEVLENVICPLLVLDR